MTDKKRLIELLDKFGDGITFCDICDRPADDCEACKNDMLAEYLLEHGVLLLPCKVGDTVYCIEFAENLGIDKGKVYAISYTETEWLSVRYESGLRYDHPQKVIGQTVFLTHEEAEQALKERS